MHLHWVAVSTPNCLRCEFLLILFPSVCVDDKETSRKTEPPEIHGRGGASERFKKARSAGIWSRMFSVGTHTHDSGQHVFLIPFISDCLRWTSGLVLTGYRVRAVRHYRSPVWWRSNRK